MPAFLPEVFFIGRLEGWAVFESLTGGLQKRATIVGLTLRWTIRKSAPGKYNGIENRLEGDAKGEQAGCAFHWKYTRNTPQAGGKSTKLNFDDWFYMIEERACIVRGSAGRAGLPFATAHVTYVKLNPQLPKD